MKEKGYSARDKRVTETTFNRKMEIENKMAEDKEREVQRLAKLGDTPKTTVNRPMTSAVKRVSTQGAVRRPMTPRVGRGF